MEKQIIYVLLDILTARMYLLHHLPYTHLLLISLYCIFIYLCINNPEFLPYYVHWELRLHDLRQFAYTLRGYNSYNQECKRKGISPPLEVWTLGLVELGRYRHLNLIWK